MQCITRACGAVQGEIMQGSSLKGRGRVSGSNKRSCPFTIHRPRASGFVTITIIAPLCHSHRLLYSPLPLHLTPHHGHDTSDHPARLHHHPTTARPLIRRLWRSTLYHLGRPTSRRHRLAAPIKHRRHASDAPSLGVGIVHVRRDGGVPWVEDEPDKPVSKRVAFRRQQ